MTRRLDGRPPAFTLALALCAMLIGCATPTGPAVPGEPLAGRLAVRVESDPPRAMSAGFELTGTQTQGQLTLSGPLGATAAQAMWSPGRASLVTGEGRTEYPDLDTLASDALGERIPLAALFDWLRGRAWAGAASLPRRDGAPGFQQLGWEISLARWADGWVEARRIAPPAVTVRARVDTTP